MLKLALFVLALAASANAIWLYSGQAFNVQGGFGLFATNTDTGEVRRIGTVTDNAGDMFSIMAMTYMNSTGLLYAAGSGRSSNPLKRGGLMAIDPATARGMFLFLFFSALNFLYWFMAFFCAEAQISEKSHRNKGGRPILAT
jgi:hypothetical protein